MQLTPHFSLEEFTASATARSRGFDNTLPVDLLPEARRTMEMLERIRSHLTRLAGHEVPMQISSGYRCLDLNRAIGSKDSSDHPKAMAADWIAPAFGSPYRICKTICSLVDELDIGQLIYECPAAGRLWVHTSTRQPTLALNRVITIAGARARVGIQEI